MTQIFYSLAVLACPVGMGLMMWFMMRGTKQSTPPAPTPQDDPTGAELARLRAEIDQLQSAQREAKSAPQDSKPAR
jgi:hypothetical protein